VTVTTDASGTGWGAVCNEKSAQGFWSVLEREFGNNVLELLAGGFGVQSFEEDVSGKVTLLQMDNTTAISYINKMGGRKPLLCQIVQRIWDWCLERETFLVATHIPGELNVKADLLSRRKFDRNDWMVNPNIFQRINEIWGPYDMDLFASRLNRQVNQFFSWKAEPESRGIDAFRQNWRRLRGWANPPFNLIGRVLNKVQRDKASVTLIVPLWPSQHWFPVLMHLATDWPILLPDRSDLFLPGFLGNEIPYGHANWRATAWRISGNRKHTEEFQKEFSSFLQREGVLPPEIRTTMDGKSLHLGGIGKDSLMRIFRLLDW
jgi:hypothetical protein